MDRITDTDLIKYLGPQEELVFFRDCFEIKNNLTEETSVFHFVTISDVVQILISRKTLRNNHEEDL